MLGLDASFQRIDQETFTRMKNLGYGVYIGDLWTGGYENNPGIKAVAEANLRDAQSAGLIVAAYSNANPWWPVATSVKETKANAGAMWPHIKVVAVDLEIAGTTEQQAYDLGMAFEAEGKRVCVYTARWYWNSCGQPAWSSLARWPLWAADYDGIPELDTAPFGPWQGIMGKQYAGSVSLEGKTVDLNVFEDSFFKEENMATLEELEAAIKKERADRELGASWIAAAIAYHMADTNGHTESAYYAMLDARRKAAEDRTG